MEKPLAIHNTFVIEKHYAATPEKVFAAFADPKRKQKWFAEGEHHALEVFELDFRVGGTEKSKSRFNEGLPHVGGLTMTNDTTYLDIQDNRRIVTAAAMKIQDNIISASLVTVELLAAKGGTDLILTHQAAFFEGADGPEMRKEGWEKLLTKLGSVLQ